MMNPNKQNFYCEICKISCDSDIVFATHLKGQKHVKKLNSPPEQAVTSKEFFCAICNVMCTGEKNFECHLSGTKHQKTVNLQNKLNAVTNSVPSEGEEKICTEETTGDMPEMPGITVNKSAHGKSVEFNCTVCDCILNSPVALNIHVQGKKHKSKINPQPPQSKKAKTERQPFGASAHTDDRYIFYKHGEIEPTPKQISLVMKFVQSVETALRRANAIIAGELEEAEKQNIKSEVQDIKSEAIEATVDITDKVTEDSHVPMRVSRAPIKLVRRVGNFFKGLLQKNDLDTEMVVICKSRPTKTLVKTLCDKVDSLLKEMNRECVLQLSSNCLTISQSVATPTDDNDEEVSTDTPTPPLQLLKCNIYFTMKNADLPTDANGTDEIQTAPEDALDIEGCALAAKMWKCARWFEFNSSFRPCLVMQRIMRDIKKRNPIWECISDWALELFVHRSLTVECTLSALTPSQALRRIFESVIEGIGEQLDDPCECSGIIIKKEEGLEPNPPDYKKINVLANLTDENRESLIESAQMNLKLIDSGEIYKVLGYDKPLEESEFQNFSMKSSRINQYRRKRTFSRPTNNKFSKKALVEKNELPNNTQTADS